MKKKKISFQFEIQFEAKIKNQFSYNKFKINYIKFHLNCSYFIDKNKTRHCIQEKQKNQTQNIKKKPIK